MPLHTHTYCRRPTRSIASCWIKLYNDMWRNFLPLDKTGHNSRTRRPQPCLVLSLPSMAKPAHWLHLISPAMLQRQGLSIGHKRSQNGGLTSYLSWCLHLKFHTTTMATIYIQDEDVWAQKEWRSENRILRSLTLGWALLEAAVLILYDSGYQQVKFPQAVAFYHGHCIVVVNCHCSG
jgi:hypothetical protein